MKKKLFTPLIAVFVVISAVSAVLLLCADKNGYLDMNIPNPIHYNNNCYNEGNWYYTIDEEYGLGIISCKRVVDSLEIPGTLAGQPVRFVSTVINDKQAARVKSISIPDSVESFVFEQFLNTPWYESQPDGVVYLNKTACTYKGQLPENGVIEIREGTEYIEENAFSGSEAKAFILPDTLRTIGWQAFSGCKNLKSIKIPASVTALYGQSFIECENLGDIDFPDTFIDMSALDFYGCGWWEKLPDGPVYAGRNLIAYLGDMPENTEITVKAGTIGISDFVFETYKNISYINIPESCRYISDWAFNDSVLKGFRVDKNNKHFSVDEKGSLYDKDKTKLIKYAILDESKEFTVPGTVTEINCEAFCRNSSLEKITVHENVTFIDDDAFWQCPNIKEFDIHPDNKFYSSADGNLYNKDETELICYANGKKDRSFTIPESVVDVDDYAFNCSAALEEIVLHDKIEDFGTIDQCLKIGENSFKGTVSDDLVRIFLQCCGGTNECYDVDLRNLLPE